MTWGSLNPVRSRLSRRESDEIEKAITKGSVHFKVTHRKASKLLLWVVEGAIGMVIFLLAWQLVAEMVYTMKDVSFPNPYDTFVRLGALLGGQKLYDYTIYDHTLASLTRWAIGYILAVALGLVLGIAIGVSRPFRNLSMTSVTIIQLIPGLAWIPIALLIFGLGEVATIFIIFMTVLPTIIISTASAIQSAPPIYVKAARIMGMSRFSTFFKVLIPSSSLQILTGLRVGLANGWRVLIAAEMIVGIAIGLGFSLIQSRWSLDFVAAFVSIMIICVIGLFIEKFLFNYIERRLMSRLGINQGG